MRSLPMLKCSSDRWVCAPHSLSAGTFTSPRLSVSLRTSATAHLTLICGTLCSSSSPPLGGEEHERLLVRRPGAQRLDGSVTFLVVETPPLAGFGRLRLLARHWRAGGGAGQRHHAIERFLAVALLAALAPRHPPPHPPPRPPTPRQPFPPLAH